MPPSLFQLYDAWPQPTMNQELPHTSTTGKELDQCITSQINGEKTKKTKKQTNLKGFHSVFIFNEIYSFVQNSYTKFTQKHE